MPGHRFFDSLDRKWIGIHAVNHRLIIVGIGPPRTCAIPGHSRRIVRPSDPAGNNAAGNSPMGEEWLEQRRPQASGSCRDRANCRRVISILTRSSLQKNLTRLRVSCLNPQKLL